MTEDSSAFSPLIYKFNVFHFSVYTVIYLLQIWRFCILFSFQLHGLHKIFPFLWGILFIFFPPFHFFPSPVSFFLRGNMWCRLVKGKTSFSFIYLGERGMKRQVNSQKKSGQGVQGWQTILLLIRPINTTDLPKNQPILLKSDRIFKATFGEKQSVKNGWFCRNFQGKFRKISIDFALISQACSMFFNRDNYLLFQQQSAWEMSQWEGFNIMTTVQFSQFTTRNIRSPATTTSP